MAEKPKKSLFLETFPTKSKKEWLEKIEKDLKGKDIDRLSRQTFEGFKVPPVFTKEDLAQINWLDQCPGRFPFVRGNNTKNNNWLIRQNIDASDPKAANKKALSAIQKGAEEIGFVVPTRSPGQESIMTLLKDINSSEIGVVFIPHGTGHNMIKDMAHVLGDQRVNSIRFETDLLTDLYLIKNNDWSKGRLKDQILSELSLGNKIFPGSQLFFINGSFFANQGTSIVHELAYSLAVGVEYLCWISDSELNFSSSINSLAFKMGIGPNFFMEIAKLKALRLLWSACLSAYNTDLEHYKGLFIHSTPSEWNKTKYDPHVNMLRYGTEAMSAALGGANSINIYPFDKTQKTPSVFSERIARNTQILLKEESYFNWVVDPGGGSYYIENLTDQLAKEAWSLFLDIEKKGGYLETLKEGYIHDSFVELQKQREQSVNTRKTIILGTNHYPNLSESNEKSELTGSKMDMIKSAGNDEDYKAANHFELLRNKTESLFKDPVSAFIFPFGSPAMSTARATFAYNFLGCGGFLIEDLTGIENINEGLKKCQKENPEIIVFCSSDQEYAQVIPEIIDQLPSKTIFMVAGYPENDIELLTKKGVKYFIHFKSNVFETLQSILKTLELNKYNSK